jgi:hypothetical protein
MYTVEVSAYGIEDFTGANTAGLTQATNIHHNVVLSSGFGIGRPTLADSYGFTTPFNVYNNTIVLNGTVCPALWMTAEPAGQGPLNVYDNIYTGAFDGSGYKSFLTDAKAPSIWDYNLYKSTGMTWALRTDANLSAVHGTYTTQAAFASAMSINGGISGADSHSVANDTPGFANTGALAELYKLASGSPAVGAGRSDGTASGSACDIGAWGGASPPTQIGSDF